MCLGIPGKVVRWIEREATIATAEVEFEGVTRVCQMACVTEAEEGDYVIVHAGVAIALIDVEEAMRVFDELAALGDDVDWRGENP
jgi:hydrogenase expression/formation protein HypC